MTVNSKRMFHILLQVLIIIVIFGGLLWYVGIGSLVSTLSIIKWEFLLLAFLAYFGINLAFTVRLRRILGREGFRTSFGRTLLAQFAGMLTSDVTPGRTGYFLTPVYLKSQNVPTSVSLSIILGIQTIDFLVKVFGGVLAIAFLVETVNLTGGLLVVASLGLVLMFVGAIVLATMSWSQCMMSIINRIASSRFLARFTGSLMEKLEEYGESSRKTRKFIPEITFFTVLCWFFTGFEWSFLGSALGITQIGWFGFFLLHPLVTAMSFVPLTPSGIGFQEGVIVGIFVLLGTSMPQALAFALLSRVLVMIEDLIGAPQIAKSTSGLILLREVSSDKPMNK